MGGADPTLPRYGSDFIILRVVMGGADPTLPRYGSDFIDAEPP